MLGLNRLLAPSTFILSSRCIMYSLWNFGPYKYYALIQYTNRGNCNRLMLRS